MVNIVRQKHRLAGGSGAPGAVGLAGELAVNFSVAGSPELYGSDGASWIRLNNAASFASSSEVITGTDTTKTIAAAALSGASVLGISAGVGDASKYVRLDATGYLDPGLFGGNITSTSAGAADAGKLVELDAAGKIDVSMLDLATAAEIQAGTGTTNLVEAAQLAAASITTFGSAADAGKYIRADANGKIDPTLLPISAMEFKGSVGGSAAAPAAVDTGDVYIVNAAGTLPASWTGAGGTAVGVGDQLIYDGTNWNVVQSAVPTDLYVPLAGTAGVAATAMNVGAKITFDPTASMDVILEGSKAAGTFGSMDRFAIDCGTF